MQTKNTQQEKLTATQAACMLVFLESGARDEGDMLVRYDTFNGVICVGASAIPVSRIAVKRAVRGLLRAGLVEHLPSINYEGQPYGSGFKLTAAGEKRSRTLEECAAWWREWEGTDVN